MGEKIYVIPVNDAFDLETECPICAMYTKLESDAIDFMMGPSYMEDDIRMETDEMGFCKSHMKMLSTQKNRLGLALILKTHLDRQKKEGEKFKNKKIKPASFLKKAERSEVSEWSHKKTQTCYICKRIQYAFPHYLDTVLYLYKKDAAFREKYEHCKGFCQEHLGELIDKAQEVLNKEDLERFYNKTLELYLENIGRLSEELDYFCDKFDYRYKDAPWKNSKDAIERGIVKTNGVLLLKSE